MIRRAQAEALLKLAEALEECERNGVPLSHGGLGMFIGPDDNIECILPDSKSVHVRMAITRLYPKSEAAE